MAKGKWNCCLYSYSQCCLLAFMKDISKVLKKKSVFDTFTARAQTRYSQLHPASSAAKNTVSGIYLVVVWEVIVMQVNLSRLIGKLLHSFLIFIFLIPLKCSGLMDYEATRNHQDFLSYFLCKKFYLLYRSFLSLF